VLLSDVELKAEIEAGRLVFEPELPSERIQSSSIDLSLSRHFWKSRVPRGEGLRTTVDVEIANPYDYLEHTEADELILESHEFALSETAEGVSLPQHLTGLIEGKSGRARHALLIHCTAPHVAPGWGIPKPKAITLELVNLGEERLLLRAGMGIAQLLVMRLGLPSAVLYSGRHASLGSPSG
jgi:deoxycytidine triphosphate deaminase